MTVEHNSSAASEASVAEQTVQEGPKRKRTNASRARAKTSSKFAEGIEGINDIVPVPENVPAGDATANAKPKRATRQKNIKVNRADSTAVQPALLSDEVDNEDISLRTTERTTNNGQKRKKNVAVASKSSQATTALGISSAEENQTTKSSSTRNHRSRKAGANKSSGTTPDSGSASGVASSLDEVITQQKASIPKISLEMSSLQPQGTDELSIDQPAAFAGDGMASTTQDDVPNEDGHDEIPHRKSRRGRRGGRGRNRKKAQSEAVITTEDKSQTLDKIDTSDNVIGNLAQDKQLGEQHAVSGINNVSKSVSKRRMFISVLPGEEVEVALVQDGQVLEYYLDMLHQRKLKGNIYKGIIHNIDTNLQAAFVSYGTGKNGFLQIDEVHPEYWLTYYESSKGKKFPPIQKVLKPGQEVLVQVVKEPTGNKGAFLTTWLSLAGRFLVLTPGQEQIGVSRKVEDEDERARLREMMNGIDPGQGLGVIVRTVSAGTTKTTLKNDLQYLKRVWRDIRKKGTEATAPALIYQEPGLSERAVRDYLTEDVSEIWVDNDEVAQSVRETVGMLFPRKKDLVRLHTDARTTMWERFNLQRQLEQIYSREVLLPSGGRLVFDQTEALMAIDINSGKISGKGNFEAMAHKTNMEAAEAIARHLKLRDIGGQVVIDFIEMRDKKHVAEVEKTLRTAMKNDRARHDVAHMSSFGLLELVRQRTGSSALSNSLEPCPSCGGTGMRRNIEWQALQALRELRRVMSVETRDICIYTTEAELALYLLNHKRDSLREIERDYGKCLEIVVRP